MIWVDFLWPGLGSSMISHKYFSPCHPPPILKHLPLWLKWVRMMKYLEILDVMGRNVFMKNVFSTVLRAPGEAHLLGVSSPS